MIGPFGELGAGFAQVLGPDQPITPPGNNLYVAEDGSTPYVAEDGVTNYIIET